MHGEVAEVEQHLVSGKLLLRHIVPVEDDDGHTQEQVEVVGLRREAKRGLHKRRRISKSSICLVQTHYKISVSQDPSPVG